MRVVWKDSAVRGYAPKQYRGFNLTKLNNGAWVTDVPSDKYMYHNLEMAKNAVDEMLGRETRKKNLKRMEMGIKIVGVKDGVEQ